MRGDTWCAAWTEAVVLCNVAARYRETLASYIVKAVAALCLCSVAIAMSLSIARMCATWPLTGYSAPHARAKTMDV